MEKTSPNANADNNAALEGAAMEVPVPGSSSSSNDMAMTTDGVNPTQRLEEAAVEALADVASSSSSSNPQASAEAPDGVPRSSSSSGSHPMASSSTPVQRTLIRYEMTGNLSPDNVADKHSSWMTSTCEGSQKAQLVAEQAWRNVSTQALTASNYVNSLETVAFLLSAKRLAVAVKADPMLLDAYRRRRDSLQLRFSAKRPSALDLVWVRGYLSSKWCNFVSAFTVDEREEQMDYIKELLGCAMWTDQQGVPMLIDWYAVPDLCLKRLLCWGSTAMGSWRTMNDTRGLGVCLRKAWANQNARHSIDGLVDHYLDNRVASLSLENRKLFCKLASRSSPAAMLHVLNEVRHGYNAFTSAGLVLPDENCGKIMTLAARATNLGRRPRDKNYGRGAAQAALRSQVVTLQTPPVVRALETTVATPMEQVARPEGHLTAVVGSTSSTVGASRSTGNSLEGLAEAAIREQRGDSVGTPGGRRPATVGDGVDVVNTGGVAGNSLVATRSFAMGDLVTEYVGQVCTHQEERALAELRGPGVHSHARTLNNGELNCD